MAATRPTILQIIPALDTGGAELSTLEIAAAIVAGGGRAIVVTGGGRLVSRIIAAGGEIIPFPAGTKNPAQMMLNARALAGIIRRENVDLIHARSRAPAWSALSAARATKRPFITTYHGAYNEKGPLKRAYNSVMARGDVVIANSAYTANLVRSRYGTPMDKIRIIHRGVDQTAFDRDKIGPDRLGKLRDAWSVAPGQPVILQAARLTSWKGQPVVLDAFAAYRKANPGSDAVAVLAGDDQGRTLYSGELKRQISALGLENHVRLAGHVEDMPAAFSLATVTVIASIEPEAFGRTSIEAQMMGCPVIATSIGAPPETVLAPPHAGAALRTGWLVEPGNAAELASALTEALNLSPDAGAALAARAKAHVSQHFSLKAMKQATLSVYDELLGTHLSESARTTTGIL